MKFEKEVFMRGVLTDEIKEKAKELFGYKISTAHLRLLPYIQYVVVNDKKIEKVKVSEQEISIIRKWSEEGYISIDKETGIVSITKEFWNIICELIYESYVK
jgi:hypothetical protein